MAHSTFGERYAYAGFLYHLEHGRPPTHAEVGKAVGRKGQAVTLWEGRDTPPPDYRDGRPLHAPLAAFFGVPERWLIDGIGEPPRPEMWAEFIARHRRRAVAEPTPPYMPKRSASAERKGGRKHRAG